MRQAVYRVAATTLLGLACVAGVASAQSAVSPDDQFAQLRDAARKNDVTRAWSLAAQLGGYEIPSYIEYYRIKPQMFDSSGLARLDAPVDQIRSFLERYRGDAIADRLRNDWLLVLGKQRDWTNFDAEYPQFALKDDPQVECYALLSAAQKGQKVADAARRVLVVPKSYGEGCVDLIGYLAQGGQFSRADVAFQARQALEQNFTTLAGRIAATTNGGERVDGDTLATVVKMARNDPSQAAAYLQASGASLPREEQGAGWGVVAQFAAKKLMPEAAQWYRRQLELGGDRWLSDETQEWRVRAALRAGDWKLVRQSVEAMRMGLRDDPAWIYWYGRALKAEKRDAEAREQFASIAQQYNFYGQLALEELGQRITLPPRTTVSDAEVEQMRGRKGFARAAKFYAMDMRFEGNREWNWELRGMTDRQLLAAAEYARRIQLLDRTVNSADRTRDEHDFTLRFIMPYRDIMRRATDQLGLDMAWTYGLIRQESRFIMNARSHVGASGLMQVMPATARYVARRIGLSDFHPRQMDDPTVNIQLGTNYLNMVLNDLDGSWTMASAAYNAGPGRPKNWRSSLNRTVEGAIFAETIPFTETRGYVKNVLSNATYYAAIISGQPQSLRARLGQVAPSQAVATNLP
ncbi:lytic transglycosylase domain-containing protein [Imbroritus primus]|uniref:lytic transglycosylase domain-containing protein n=1 Tax=Imbroritus primus TaxID=3058603 RepID=UPI00026970C9